MDEPDPRLVRAAAAGDDGAFTELVRHCQADVWRFLRHLTGDGDLATDLTQDTFVLVFQRLDTYRFEAPFSAWLMRIARNRGIDELRRQQRRARLDRVLRSRVVRQAQVMTTSPDTDSIELETALAAIGADHREVFVLVEILGFKYREAAVVLDVADGTVKSRLFGARRALVEWFRADDLGEEEADHG